MAHSVIFKTPEGEKTVMDLYRRGLSLWNTPYEELYIETSRGRTFMIAMGDPAAPPLVLLHGSGGNALTWYNEALYFSSTYRVYAVDILGEAGRSEANRLPFESKEHVFWLQELFDKLGIQKAAVAGNSLGGWIALQLGIYAPGLVEKLVLICPGGIYAPRMGMVFLTVFLSLFGKPGMKLVGRIVFGDTPITKEAELLVSTMAKHYNYRVESLPVFSDEELGSLNVPVLLIAGKNDVYYNSPKSAARLRKLLPGARVNVLHNQGHGLYNLEKHMDEFL